MGMSVLSDTHIHLAEEIPAEIITAFSNVDLIVHAGDFVGSAVLEGPTVPVHRLIQPLPFSRPRK